MYWRGQRKMCICKRKNVLKIEICDWIWTLNKDIEYIGGLKCVSINPKGIEGYYTVYV